MADEKIVIKIDVDARTTAIEKTTQAVKRLKRESGKFSSGRDDVNSYVKNLDNRLGSSAVKMKRHFDFLDAGVKMFGKTLTKFLGFALKGVVLEMAALGAAMVGIHALFVAGRYIAKAYSGTMQIVAGGAAAATVAIATAAAAIREQQAAMYAYRGRGANELGGGTAQAGAAMRALQMDADLAGLGVANLNQAYAAMSKTMSTPQINASTGLFKNLMDFGAAGQDPGKAAAKVGQVIADIADTKKSLSQVIASAKQISPEVEVALKKTKITSKKQLQEMIMSGELAKLGGVAGQFDAVNNTLIGKAKIFFSLIKGQFADFGQQFLEPAKVAFQKIYRIIGRDLQKLMAATSSFGTGTFMDTLVNAVDKTSGFVVSLVQKWLPKTQGFFEGIGKWWERFRHGWNMMVDGLRPFIESAKVIEEAFKPIWEQLKAGGIDNMNLFRQELIDNKDEVIEFGTRVGELIKSVSTFAQNLKKAFMDILPFLNDILSGAKMFFDMLAGGLTKFAGAGMLGSLFPLMAYFVGGKQMAGTKGGFLPTSTSNMNVNANSVVVTGPGIGGPTALSSGLRQPVATTSPTGTPRTPRGVTGTSESLASGGKSSALSDIQKSMTGKPVQTVGANTYGTPIIASTLPNANAGYFSRTATKANSWMGGLMAPATYRVGDKTGEQLPGKTGTENLRQKARWARTNSRLGAGLFGNEAAGIKGINNSMGAKMGVGMGMAALSQYAPEEMRGSLAMGSTLAMINPMLGLGVGFGGAAMKSQSAVGGGLTGAAGGAALGTMLFPGVGTAIGAAIGAIGGTMMGAANKLKVQAKESKSAVNAAFDGLLTGIAAKALKEINLNQRVVESGGSLAGKDAVLGTGSQQLAKKTSGLKNKIDGVTAMGDTNKTSYAGNTFKGAAAGAVVGTYLGAVAGLGIASVPAAAVGAIAGTIIGGAAGAIYSIGDYAFGRFKGDSKKAKAQSDLIQDIYDNQLAYGMEISEKQLEAMMKDKEAAIKQLKTRIEDTNKVQGEMDKVYLERVDLLSEMSGKSGAEIEVLAQKMGVNLYDATVEFTDVAVQLGLSLKRTAGEMKAAMQNALLDATTIFDLEIKSKKAIEVIDQKARTIKDQFDSGVLGEEAKMEYVSAMTGDMLAFYKGDAVKSYYAMTEAFGTGGIQYGAGKALEGMEAALSPFFKQLFAEQQKKLFTESGVEIQAMLNNTDLMMSDKNIQKFIKGLDPKKQQEVLGQIQDGTFGEVALRMGGTQKYLESLGATGITAIPEAVDRMTGDMDAVAESLGVSSQNFKTAVESFISFGATIFSPGTQAPTWWTNPPPWMKPGGDTGSPRGSRIGDTTSSRLEQTMGRHAAMNSQLSGTRQITSAYRNYALGSPSSDHVMGRAYDLVGQNLGAYSKLVHANGGFAEFHGNNANRHLHVVPGPGAMGDTSVPSFGRMPTGTSSPGGSSVTNNITVNGAPGQSPEAIAAVVIQKIEARERNMRERR
jgi:hypothetical protein